MVLALRMSLEFILFLRRSTSSARCVARNVGNMGSGGFRCGPLSTETETTIDVLHLATHKPRHYLYAMLCTVVYYSF
jgi:hypothetical protein